MMTLPGVRCSVFGVRGAVFGAGALQAVAGLLKDLAAQRRTGVAAAGAYAKGSTRSVAAFMIP